MDPQKYCNKAATALSDAANSQAIAKRFARRMSENLPEERLDLTSSVAAHAHENNIDIATGVGPTENGISQGNETARKLRTERIFEKGT